jgi:hypothetical protein
MPFNLCYNSNQSVSREAYLIVPASRQLLLFFFIPGNERFYYLDRQ